MRGLAVLQEGGIPVGGNSNFNGRHWKLKLTEMALHRQIEGNCRGVLRLVVHPSVLVHLGDDDTRIDGVDADPLGGQFKRRCPRQLVNRRFAHVVSNNAGKGPQP